MIFLQASLSDALTVNNSGTLHVAVIWTNPRYKGGLNTTNTFYKKASSINILGKLLSIGKIRWYIQVGNLC